MLSSFRPMMKKGSYLLVLLFAFSAAMAQKASIKGIVVDKLNHQPVEYASITLSNAKDSAMVNATVTNKHGVFTFEKINEGEYVLKIAFIGYVSKYRNKIFVTGSDQLTIDSIQLVMADRMLNEITVSGTQKKSYNKIDKQVYRSDQFENAKGGSAVDVLKNLPSVSVNGQGEISVRGSTGFLVLVNGKPVVTDAQTVLSQLPANTIQNIELITAPSAKYDPDGKAGIINIITTKGSADGIAVNANLQGGLPSTTQYQNLEGPKRFGGDITLSVKQDKWDISVGGNYQRNDVNGRREGDVFTKNFANNTITRFPSNGERSFDKYNYAARASVIYTADKNNMISVGFFTGKKFQARRADLLYHNSTSDLTTNAVTRQSVYFNSNVQTKEGNFTLGNFDFTHVFDNKSTIAVSLSYEHANLYGNTINRNLDYPSKTYVLQDVNNPYLNPIDGYRLKLDHSVLVGSGKLEMGYQYRFDTQDGQFDYVVTPATSQPDAARFRGTARSKNTIHSFYSQYTGKINKLQYSAGLRYEYAMRKVELSYDPNPHTLNLANFFPSANLLYTFNTAWNIKTGYSKRIQRNNNFELNPIPEREHSETLEQGDPDLLPQFIDLAEIGLNHTFKNGTFFTTLYYQHIKNPIQRVNSVYADTILNRLFTNAEKARLIGIEIGTNIKPVKWLSLYIGANVYNYKVDGKLNVLGAVSNVNNAAWVYSINSNNSFDLGKKWSLQAGVNYISARPTAQGEDSRFLVPNTSIKKTFRDTRFSLGLQWQNMNLGFINANQQRITTFGNNFYTTTNYIYETDVLLLNFSFSLNKLNSKTKMPNSEIGEKEF